MVTFPPVPLFPDPTEIETEPPFPDEETPLPMLIEPLVIELDVPVLNTSPPLTPLTPAFDVSITTDPLLD
jgi:hypothetical protein